MLYWHWMILGLSLISLEIMTPGFYFLWIGLAGIITGGLSYLFPEIGFIIEGTFFAIISIIFCYLGKFSLYKKIDNQTDSTLNRRGSQYVGTKVVVFKEILDGFGKVKVGDSVWTAKSGEDVEVGKIVEIIGVEGIELVVKKV